MMLRVRSSVLPLRKERHDPTRAACSQVSRRHLASLSWVLGVPVPLPLTTDLCLPLLPFSTSRLRPRLHRGLMRSHPPRRAVNVRGQQKPPRRRGHDKLLPLPLFLVHKSSFFLLVYMMCSSPRRSDSPTAVMKKRRWFHKHVFLCPPGSQNSHLRPRISRTPASFSG